MDKEFIDLVHSFCVLRSKSPSDIESQFSKARALVLDRAWRKDQYGLLVMGVHTMMLEFLKLVGTHKYCEVHDRTPEKRSIDNILATLNILAENIGNTQAMRMLYRSFKSCGSRCCAGQGSWRKCMNHVDRGGHYAEKGIRMTVDNVPNVVEPLTKHQLSSIRTYKMAPRGTRVEKVVKRSFD